MSIYRIWVPGEKGYKEHLDRVYIANEQTSAIKEQSTRLKREIEQNAKTQNETAQKLIANNEQIIAAIDSGFSRLSEINKIGFDQVTSTIESFHSDMNYLIGTLIQKIEYSNNVLNSILQTLQQPFETQVREYYNNGCKFLRQENLTAAVECFKESIDLKMGKYFFPSYYQLGRLYLSGKVENGNIVNPKLAMNYLIKADELAVGVVKDDPSFKPILADCKFFLSQSCFYQLSGTANVSELNLIESAIKSCEDSVHINKNLSQAHYHVAKYRAYRMKHFPQFKNEEEIEKILISFINAIELDRNYLRAFIPKDTIMYDSVFENISQHFIKLMERITEIKEKEAKNMLLRAKKYITKLEDLDTANSSNYKDEFIGLKKIVQLAERNYQNNNYFGYDDCVKNLKEL